MAASPSGAEVGTLTTGQVAAMCHVSRSTIRRAVQHGDLRAWHTPGKHLRFDLAACQEFMRSMGNGGPIA